MHLLVRNHPPASERTTYLSTLVRISERHWLVVICEFKGCGHHSHWKSKSISCKIGQEDGGAYAYASFHAPQDWLLQLKYLPRPIHGSKFDNNYAKMIHFVELRLPNSINNPLKANESNLSHDSTPPRAHGLQFLGFQFSHEFPWWPQTSSSEIYQAINTLPFYHHPFNSNSQYKRMTFYKSRF